MARGFCYVERLEDGVPVEVLGRRFVLVDRT